MSYYYGASMAAPTSRHVICHRITVQEYQRTLPNGKTITVRGYSRDGQAAVEQARTRERTNRQLSETASRSYNRAVGNARTAASYYNASRQSPTPMTARVNKAQSKNYAGKAIRNVGEAIGATAQRVGNRVSWAAQDFAEIASMTASNFMEQVRYGAAYAGAAASEVAKRIAAAAKKAYDTGKSFIQQLFGKIKSAVGTAAKAVSNAARTAAVGLRDTYDRVTGNTQRFDRQDQLKRRKKIMQN